jgi:hypothetical protein
MGAIKQTNKRIQTKLTSPHSPVLLEILSAVNGGGIGAGGLEEVVGAAAHLDRADFGRCRGRVVWIELAGG